MEGGRTWFLAAEGWLGACAGSTGSGDAGCRTRRMCWEKVLAGQALAATLGWRTSETEKRTQIRRADIFAAKDARDLLIRIFKFSKIARPALSPI